MQGFLFFIASLYLSACYEVVKGQEDICRSVICPRGRMCVPHMDDGGSTYTTCECPTTCPAGVNELVCSYYNTEFNSLCEMHKYGCAHDLTMKVKNEGSCPTDNENICVETHMLQFPGRYLEWIMIAREYSIDPAYSLNFSARADALTEDERKEVLTWEFDFVDKNKNNVLDNEEKARILDNVLQYEPCIDGFLESCDQNGNGGIERREWDSCFPVTSGTAFETRK